MLPNPAQAGTPANLAGGQTAAGATSSYLICRAQMGTAGANTFYGTTTTQVQNGAGAGGALSFVYQVGNRNLESEVADTWTAGIVLRSPFEHALLNRITATFDWYSIAIDDAILRTPWIRALLCYARSRWPMRTRCGAGCTPACQRCFAIP